MSYAHCYSEQHYEKSAFDVSCIALGNAIVQSGIAVHWIKEMNGLLRRKGTAQNEIDAVSRNGVSFQEKCCRHFSALLFM